MAKLVVQEQPDFPTLPDDSIIHVMVEGVEIRTVSGSRGDWDKLEFTFKILGIQNIGNGEHPSNYDKLLGEKIYGSVPARITDSQENKCRIWAEALLGRELPVGMEIDTDWFPRRECRALTSTYEKRAINPVTNRPFVAHQVKSLLPMGSAQAAQPHVQQQAPGNWGQPQQAPQTWGAGAAPQQQPAQQQDPWGQPQQQPAQQPQPAQGGWGGQQSWEEPPF